MYTHIYVNRYKTYSYTIKTIENQVICILIFITRFAGTCFIGIYLSKDYYKEYCLIVYN